jgi:hypothetical protein
MRPENQKPAPPRVSSGSDDGGVRLTRDGDAVPGKNPRGRGFLVWGLAAGVVVVLGGWGVVSAVLDLVATPGFAGVLRLAVEAAVVMVVLGFCLQRARGSTHAAVDERGAEGTDQRQDRQARQGDRQ